MKDAELAIEMLHGARRKLITIRRCLQLLAGDAVYNTPMSKGLKFRVRAANRQAQQLIQVARSIHPATTLLGNRKARPVPPKTGPAALELAGCTPAPLYRPRVIAFSNPTGRSWIYDRFVQPISEDGVISDRAWDELYRGH